MGCNPIGFFGDCCDLTLPDPESDTIKWECENTKNHATEGSNQRDDIDPTTGCVFPRADFLADVATGWADVRSEWDNCVQSGDANLGCSEETAWGASAKTDHTQAHDNVFLFETCPESNQDKFTPKVHCGIGSRIVALVNRNFGFLGTDSWVWSVTSKMTSVASWVAWPIAEGSDMQTDLGIHKLRFTYKYATETNDGDYRDASGLSGGLRVTGGGSTFPCTTSFLVCTTDSYSLTIANDLYYGSVADISETTMKDELVNKSGTFDQGVSPNIDNTSATVDSTAPTSHTVAVGDNYIYVAWIPNTLCFTATPFPVFPGHPTDTRYRLEKVGSPNGGLCFTQLELLDAGDVVQATYEY